MKVALYAEDDEVSMYMFIALCGRLFSTLHIAYNGKEAYEIFLKEKENIELLITDVMMPEMDGLELAELVLAEKSIPIIVLTANPEIVTEFIVLPKPLDIKKVIQIIKELESV